MHNPAENTPLEQVSIDLSLAADWMPVERSGYGIYLAPDQAGVIGYLAFCFGAKTNGNDECYFGAGDGIRVAGGFDRFFVRRASGQGAGSGVMRLYIVRDPNVTPSFLARQIPYSTIANDIVSAAGPVSGFGSETTLVTAAFPGGVGVSGLHVTAHAVAVPPPAQEVSFQVLGAGGALVSEIPMWLGGGNVRLDFGKLSVPVGGAIRVQARHAAVAATNYYAALEYGTPPFFS